MSAAWRSVLIWLGLSAPPAGVLIAHCVYIAPNAPTILIAPPEFVYTAPNAGTIWVARGSASVLIARNDPTVYIADGAC
jgi:hypothetical protein